MDQPDAGLERLCKLYLNLTDEEKEELIRLGEGLLNSQKMFSNKISCLTKKNENIEIKTM